MNKRKKETLCFSLKWQEPFHPSFSIKINIIHTYDKNEELLFITEITKL